MSLCISVKGFLTEVKAKIPPLSPKQQNAYQSCKWSNPLLIYPGTHTLTWTRKKDPTQYKLKLPVFCYWQKEESNTHTVILCMRDAIDFKTENIKNIALENEEVSSLLQNKTDPRLHQKQLCRLPETTSPSSVFILILSNKPGLTQLIGLSQQTWPTPSLLDNFYI